MVDTIGILTAGVNSGNPGMSATDLMNLLSDASKHKKDDDWAVSYLQSYDRNKVLQSVATSVGIAATSAFLNSFMSRYNLAGSGTVFRPYERFINPGNKELGTVPDIFLGLLPLYGVTKFDWAESDAAVKFRAHFGEFFGHQEGQAFAMVIEGVAAGELLPMMVNTLRILKFACSPRRKPPDKWNEEADIRQIINIKTTTVGDHDVFTTHVKKPFLKMVEDVKIFQVSDTASWVYHEEDMLVHWSFPVITRETAFFNLYIENLQFQKDSAFGQENIKYRILLRRENISRRKLRQILTAEETGYKSDVFIVVTTRSHVSPSAKAAGFLLTGIVNSFQCIKAMADKLKRDATYNSIVTARGVARSSQLLRPFDLKIEESDATGSITTIRNYFKDGAYYNAFGLRGKLHSKSVKNLPINVDCIDVEYKSTRYRIGNNDSTWTLRVTGDNEKPTFVAYGDNNWVKADYNIYMSVSKSGNDYTFNLVDTS